MSERRLEVSWVDPAALATAGIGTRGLDFLRQVRGGSLPDAHRTSTCLVLKLG